MSRTITPNQTVGPYFRIGLSHLYVDEISGEGARFVIQGRVLDGDGNPVNDALLELWHSDTKGKYATAPGNNGRPAGFGRVATDSNGIFRFTTTKPGSVVGPDGRMQAPHLAVAVFMRGLLKHLVTRVYFPDERGNLDDPILELVPKERRGTLIARKNDAAANSLEWNVILQGQDETVFFDY